MCVERVSDSRARAIHRVLELSRRCGIDNSVAAGVAFEDVDQVLPVVVEVYESLMREDDIPVAEPVVRYAAEPAPRVTLIGAAVAHPRGEFRVPGRARRRRRLAVDEAGAVRGRSEGGVATARLDAWITEEC